MSVILPKSTVRIVEMYRVAVKKSLVIPAFAGMTNKKG